MTNIAIVLEAVGRRLREQTVKHRPVEAAELNG